ncbi:RICIN domain-containing protein [Gordonibacter massiliensis (ex Traore et al. 2017)]|uniref:RICIN domain-containing protein n=1 Tax=Gordonibacter massiliensis (ex Traore et al. 2017) TaxID=1841863 RepID=UPI001C8B8216|nr:RICIN domain-containing protein [Gordonibacter massiliensis (ex Traore et al. 2017)]MBX9032895.1 RICIN domain-containing protein [Gordonibacter massiliensis (ex Traore et al. 2017)]
MGTEQGSRGSASSGRPRFEERGGTPSRAEASGVSPSSEARATRAGFDADGASPDAGAVAESSDVARPGTPPSCGRSIARRTFLGLGGAAALSLLLAPRLAWGGVGGGSWGEVGAVAHPGSHFGYDGGWGHSSNGCVWLAVSCNATVGRMTELFLEMSVTSYYANGGIWSPTWFTDYPDTHVDSFVRNESGAWMSSTSGFYDTVYDCASFQGPYATHALRVRREAWDWWAWAGVRAWCDSPDSAYGIDTTAEASQLIPRHPLADDRSWQGKIATLRPEAAPHLRLDASEGGTANGTNMLAWGASDYTNQHWLVLTSAQGRTCLVPVHTGSAPLFADVSSNDWNDGDNVHLWQGTGGWNQSFWLHDLGTGYHLIVPECSGCAFDLYGGGQANGTNVVQWNCYGNWDNPNQHWMLEEPLFREREPGAMTLSGIDGAGEAEPGAVLAPADPDQACLPRNYPGTAGMFYRYAWYRGVAPGERTVLAREASEDPAYKVTEADEDAYLTCVVKAHARYGDVPYRGEVATASVRVRSRHARIRFFADGAGEPCFVDEAERGCSYEPPRAAQAAAVKPGCSGVDGWYRDAGCAEAYVDGSLVEGDLDLFARNRVELSYAMAGSSCLLASSHAYFFDEAAEHPLLDPQVLLPPPASLHYGDRVTFARGASAWYEDMGRMREASCAPGAYADADASGPLMRSARLTRNTVAYLVWRTPAYDGIALS